MKAIIITLLVIYAIGIALGYLARSDARYGGESHLQSLRRALVWPRNVYAWLKQDVRKFP